MRSVISLSDLGAPEIDGLLDEGARFSGIVASRDRPHPDLHGRVVTNLFFEPSTRTRLSFERAARLLGSEVMTCDPDVSSSVKGESLEDTARTLAAIGTDLFVVRHTLEDAPDRVAAATGAPVINAGTGRSEHPTQSLLDLLTMRLRFGGLSGLAVGIVGDIVNSRVANGNMRVFPLMGAKVTLIAPPALLPPAIPDGVSVTHDIDDALPGLDVVYLLRIQHERGAITGFEDDRAYAQAYGLDERRIRLLPPTAVVMHPGPINRDVEITGSVADGERSLIATQVSLGVPMRMAVLRYCLEDHR